MDLHHDGYLSRSEFTEHWMEFWAGEHRSGLIGEDDAMDWPVRFPAELSTGTVSVRCYDPADAGELLGPLADERVWEHMSRASPADAVTLDEVIRSRLADGYRVTFTVRQDGRAAGITSVLFDPGDPAGVEIGGTLLAPAVWGTGVNTAVKRLLLAVVFRHGAQWVQLQTDVRNGRSAAAIRKLGATELGIRSEHLVRRDGTRRRSRVFRLDRPALPSKAAGRPDEGRGEGGYQVRRGRSAWLRPAA